MLLSKPLKIQWVFPGTGTEGCGTGALLRQHVPFDITPASFSGAGPMRKGIHPDYHEINIVMTDGSTFKTRSTYGKAGDTLRLDIDPKSHPAWTGVHRLVDSGGQLAKFNTRFSGIGLKTK
jgi:large subunit ribosomal protein L31